MFLSGGAQNSKTLQRVDGTIATPSHCKTFDHSNVNILVNENMNKVVYIFQSNQWSVYSVICEVSLRKESENQPNLSHIQGLGPIK